LSFHDPNERKKKKGNFTFCSKRDFYDKMVALVIFPREKGTKLP
jgi:hypothetical protein